LILSITEFVFQKLWSEESDGVNVDVTLLALNWQSHMLSFVMK